MTYRIPTPAEGDVLPFGLENNALFKKLDAERRAPDESAAILQLLDRACDAAGIPAGNRMGRLAALSARVMPGPSTASGGIKRWEDRVAVYRGANGYAEPEQKAMSEEISEYRTAAARESAQPVMVSIAQYRNFCDLIYAWEQLEGFTPECAKAWIALINCIDQWAANRPAAASGEAPVARLQEETSVRPYSAGKKFFEVVILDAARCFDQMPLYTHPIAASGENQPHSDVRYAALRPAPAGQRDAGASTLLRAKLYRAVIDCGHSIDENKIVLHRDKRTEGNALSQLGDRLAAAAKSDEGDALHLWLDRKQVPRADDSDKVFSLLGRVMRLPDTDYYKRTVELTSSASEDADTQDKAESRALPAAQGALTEPEAFDDYPEYNFQAMGCGLEDRNITDRYDAMRYGWEQAIERVAERIDNFLATPAEAVKPVEKK